MKWLSNLFEYKQILNHENLIEELEKGLGNGPLTLEIVCCDCNSHFELNRESVAMAFAMNTTFSDYVRYVQSSKCIVCEEKKGASDGMD